MSGRGPDAIRVLIADDHAEARRMLRRVLEAEPGCAVVGEAADGREAVALAAALLPDVVVLDHGMPGLSGLDAARAIKAARPATRVLIASMHDADGYAAAAAAAGVEAWLPKATVARLLAPAVVRRAAP